MGERDIRISCTCTDSGGLNAGLDGGLPNRE